ncbi:MAG: AAA family ATPase [Halobacteriota archaeon]
MAAREIPVLAFVGAPAAGKSEAASIAAEMGIPVVVMGEEIRAELRRRGLPLNDETAGRVATELREKEGRDAVAKRCIPRIKEIEKGIVVVDGIRGIAEVETLKEEFGDEFLLVNIEAPLTIRYERILSRGRVDNSLSLDEFKKREARENGWGLGEAMQKASIVIKNEGSLAEFKAAIKKLLLLYYRV